MRNFNMPAAVSAALPMGSGVSAMEKPGRPRPKKICRTEPMSGRITPRRICRVVPSPDTPAAGDDRKAGDSSRV